MVLVLILLNGVFAAAEIAILSIRTTRLQELVAAGSRSAGWVLTLRKDPERFLASVQVGITVTSASAAAFGGSSLAGRIAPFVARTLSLAPEHAHELALVAIVAMVSFLSLVLGELVPKSLALRSAEGWSLLVARPLVAMSWLVRPLVWLLTTTSNALLRVFGDRTSFTEVRLSPEELRQLVDEAATAGTVDPHVGEIAARALAFDDLEVGALMVPRSKMVLLAASAGLDEVAALAVREGHSRVLVHGGDPDDLLGFVHLRDVLARARMETSFKLERAIHPVTFVPPSMSAPNLLRDLQRRRTHLAVVVDEQGTILGLVTIEDLVEELVGSILSEGDRPEHRIVSLPDSGWLVDAATPVRTVSRELGLILPEGDYTTIGGLVMARLERIPIRGDRLTVGEMDLEVTAATQRKVKSVVIRRREVSEEGTLELRPST